jgi:hypothetical protein
MRFNVSEPHEYFINEGCFGDDFAKWLRERFLARGLQVIEPGQEDWGWYIEVTTEQGRYFLGISGYRKGMPATGNVGEWRIIVQKHRAIADKLTGKNKIRADETILATIEEILRADGSFANVRRESG